jgi:glycosyltransferase involved in cell wall biosynthesis
MIEGQNIICFAPTDWWGMNPSCTTHLMRRFAKKNRVLYINPFSSDLLVANKSGITKRIARKLKSIVKLLKQPQKNLYIFSPIFLPFQGKRTIDALNNFLLRVQIKAVCSLTGMSGPLLWIENLRAADLLESFQPIGTIFHISDLFVEDEYVAHQEILRQREEKISKASDILICVSQGLYDAKSAHHNNVVYLPHGVDFELFREAAQKGECIEELTGVPKPIAGYFGTMTAYNDIELLLWCARNLPDVSFVFAGQITGGDYSELGKLNNVYLLGRMPYEKIPQLCACFDVCMLQWKMSRWIECCNPLKMFEYMASGKPIVSVPIKEAMQYSDIISIAHNKEQFAEAIRWELQNDTPERARKRIEIAKNHSWDTHVEKISELIENAITTKQSGQFHLAGQSLGEIS